MSVNSYQGALVAAGPEGFEGWAWNQSLPYDPILVELMGNGAVLARVRADLFDMELVRNNIGNGMHAFRVQLDKLPDGPYPLIISARIAGGGPEISGQFEFKAPGELKGVVADTAFHDFEGNLDGVRNGKVCGWIWNRCLPDEPALVSLYDGSVHIGSAVASEYRADLDQAGKASGHCAFTFDLPLNMLDGELHSLHVRVQGTNYQLPNSPLVFGPNSAHTLIELVVQLRQEVDRLSRQVKEITDPKSTPTKQLADHLMQRTEALLTIQREALEREMRVLTGVSLSTPQRSSS